MDNESHNAPNSKPFLIFFLPICAVMIWCVFLFCFVCFILSFLIKALVFNNQESLLKLNCPCNPRANKSFLNSDNSLILKVLPKTLKIHLN